MLRSLATSTTSI